MNHYDILFASWEKNLLLQTLKNQKGNKCAAARYLGIHRNTMDRKLSIHGIDSAQVRAIRRAASFRKPQPWKSNARDFRKLDHSTANTESVV